MRQKTAPSSSRSGEVAQVNPIITNPGRTAYCLTQTKNKVMELKAFYAPSSGVLTKTFRIMKLTAIIILSVCLTASAKGFSQKVTLNAKNAPLETVIQQIKNQTGFSFFYNVDWLEKARAITVNIKNVNIDKALEMVFKNQPLSYRLINNTIVLELKSEERIKEEIPAPLPPVSIKGKVTDADGKILAGATISIASKNTIAGFTGIATKTDEFGEFLVTVPTGVYTVTVTYVGYKVIEKEITAGTKNLNEKFTMLTEYSQIETVQVKVNTGYQQISGERVTGSYDNIKKSQIEKPSANIAERLIGTTAGMEVKLDVNGNPTIQLRGKTTLFANNGGGGNADNNPLIVVDGFPLKGVLQNQFGGINPNDIESITILKDAAAASIWGARSSNGVIVITTKKGSQNTPLKVELSVFTRFSPKADVGYMTGLASAADAVAFQKLAFKKWGNSPISGSFYDSYKQSEAAVAMNENSLGFLTDAQLNARLTELSGLDNRKQISDYLLSNPATTQYSLTLSGGGQRMTNVLSMLAEMNQSDFKNTDNKRYALNYRTSASVFKWLDFDLSGNFQYSLNNDNGVGQYEIASLSPYDMLKNPDGSLTDIHQYNQPVLERTVPLSRFPYSFSYNPIQEINNRDRKTTFINTRIQAGLTFKIIKGLSFSSRIQYENVSNTIKYYSNDQTFAVRNQVNTTSSWDQTPTSTVTPNLPLGGILENSRSTSDAYVFRNLLNFSRTFNNKHEFNVVAGSEVSNTTAQGVYNPTTYGYNDNTLTVGSFPNGPTGTNGWYGWGNYFNYTSYYSYATQRFYSMFANAAYTYLDKYTLTGSYRTDASNLIAKAAKYRYSPFYSAGIGYEISKEKFMQNISWLNRLNLRATLGRTGNVDRSTSPFTLINLRTNPDNYTRDYLATVVDKGNPTLTWEKTETVNIGVDYALFNNKFFGKVEYYKKTGKNLLASISVPSTTGTDFAFFNNANLENKGIEITMGTSLPVKGDKIRWSGNFNFSYNKSRITKLFKTNYTGLLYGGTNNYVEGYDPSIVWATQYAGVVNDQPKIKGPDGTLLNLTDYIQLDGRTYLKNAGTLSPPYLLGFTNSFKIYDFNLSFIITAKFGAVFKAQSFTYPSSGSGAINSKVNDVLNGDPSKIVPLPANPNSFAYYGYYNANYLDYNYLNANLARLQEVNLSYNLPAKLISKLNIRSVQLTAQGNNLYTWLANKTGEDPEYTIGNIKPRALYTFGLKVEF